MVKSPKTTQVTATAQSSPKPASSNKKKNPTCLDCSKDITEDTKALQCDKCGQETAWKCITCLGITSELYDMLIIEDGPELKWFCDVCLHTPVTSSPTKDSLDKLEEIVTVMGKLMDKLSHIENQLDSKADVQQVADVETKMKAVELNIEEKMDALLCKLASKCTAEEQVQEVHERIEQKVDALTTNVEKSVAVSDNVRDIMCSTLEEDKVEEQEIQKRKTSIIIHGLAESQSSVLDERRQEDEDTVEHLLHSLNLDDISVNNVIRLGKRPESTDAKPRPIKLVVASEEAKVRVLSKSKNLPRQKKGGTTSIFMHQDLTLKQRAKRQELVKELKDRQAKGEKNLMIVNLRIVEKRRPTLRTEIQEPGEIVN